MNRFAIAKLAEGIAIVSTLLVAASPTVKASETAINPTASNSIRLRENASTSPADLVSLAHRGHFGDRGIPSFQALITAYSLRNINAERLVQAGVETGRVSPNTLNDAEYVNAVESMLNNLKTR